jgi:RimJ/RimL family protein N-acetyltransferase
MVGAPYLSGERLSLRTFEEEDVEFVSDGVNDPSVWKSVGGQSTPTNRLLEREFFEDVSHDGDAVAFVATDGETPVGMVELQPIDWEKGVAEVGVWIAATQQGNGYATEAMRLVVDYAFDQLRLHKVRTEVFDFNEASRRLMDRVGFEREGVLREEDYVDGRYVDVHRYGLLESERERGRDEA